MQNNSEQLNLEETRQLKETSFKNCTQVVIWYETQIRMNLMYKKMVLSKSKRLIITPTYATKPPELPINIPEILIDINLQFTPRYRNVLNYGR